MVHIESSKAARTTERDPRETDRQTEQKRTTAARLRAICNRRRKYNVASTGQDAELLSVKAEATSTETVLEQKSSGVSLGNV